MNRVASFIPSPLQLGLVIFCIHLFIDRKTGYLLTYNYHTMMFFSRSLPLVELEMGIKIVASLFISSDTEGGDSIITLPWL